MKFLIKLSLVLLFLSCNEKVVAQSLHGIIEKDPEKRAIAHAAILRKKLNLTDDQYKKVLSLNMVLAAKMQPVLFSNGEGYRRLKQAMPFLKEHRKAINALLTGEQRHKLDSLKREYRPWVRKLWQEWHNSK